MAYCGPRGIPYLHFLGGPNEWGDLSRDSAVAWQARENRRCEGCGQIREEWLGYDDKGEPIVDDAGNHMEAVPPPFVFEPHYCPPCFHLNGARGDKYAEASKKATHHHLARNPAAQPPGDG